MTRRSLLISAHVLATAGACAALIGLMLSDPSWRRLPSENASLNPHLLLQAERFDPETEIVPVGEMNTSTGMTRPAVYAGQVFWGADEQGRVHCLGLMFELYLSACESAAGGEYHLPSVGPYDFRSFRRDFFQGVSGSRGGRSMIDALASRGLGVELTDLSQARAGDLLQFGRNGGGGHAALFLRWEYNALGQRAAVEYWGAQEGRVGRARSTIGLRRQDINPRQIHLVRVSRPLAGRPD